MRRRKAVPIRKDFWFGVTTCAVCLDNGKDARIDPRTRYRDEPIGDNYALMEPLYLDKNGVFVSIPAGKHKVHFRCLHVLDEAGVEYKRGLKHEIPKLQDIEARAGQPIRVQVIRVPPTPMKIPERPEEFQKWSQLSLPFKEPHGPT